MLNSGGALAPVKDAEVAFVECKQFLVRVSSIGFHGVGGFVAQGVFVCAAHCFTDADFSATFKVSFMDGCEVGARVLGHYADHDVLLLVPESPLTRPFAEVGHASAGTPYIALGYGNRESLTYLSGSVCSDILPQTFQMGLGGGGSFGDSGGPVFSLRTLDYIGMIQNGEYKQNTAVAAWIRMSPVAWMKPSGVIELLCRPSYSSMTVGPTFAGFNRGTTAGHVNRGKMPAITPAAGQVFYDGPSSMQLAPGGSSQLPNSERAFMADGGATVACHANEVVDLYHADENDEKKAVIADGGATVACDANELVDLYQTDENDEEATRMTLLKIQLARQKQKERRKQKEREDDDEYSSGSTVDLDSET